jgi:3-dehydroquinate dehydratase/shikimate dehydrogenase
VASRVLGPAHGAAFTFCSLDRGRESAPGQVSLAEMRASYRADRIGAGTTVTGLAGGRVDYSLSPVMHNAAHAALGLDQGYVPFEVDDHYRFVADVLRPATRRVPWRVRGMSVTNPFKTSVAALLDRVDPLAARVGAVNTITVEGGELVGSNTDVAGAVGPLERALGPLSGALVAVVGAGGAARAVVCGLVDRGARVGVYARRLEAAREVADRFGANAFPLDALASARVDALVNATPLGTRGPLEGESPVPAGSLAGAGLVYDLVYNPAETRLLSDARRQGRATLGGLEMLAAQAALQLELWTGRTAPERLMYEAAAAAL